MYMKIDYKMSKRNEAKNHINNTRVSTLRNTVISFGYRVYISSFSYIPETHLSSSTSLCYAGCLTVCAGLVSVVCAGVGLDLKVIQE